MKEDERFINELFIWQASELARKRRYKEAEKILQLFDSSDTKRKANAYDLLGRIMIKKKKFAEAKSYFQKAIAFDPDNMSPREALKYLPIYLRNRRLFKIIGIPLILVLICLGAWTIAHSSRSAAIVQTQSPRLADSSSEPKNSAGASIPSESIVTQEKIDWPSFDISGVTSNLLKTEMRISFDNGIFVDKCELADESPSLLTAVAEHIKQSSEKFVVVIEGRTDNVPVVSGSYYKDNYLLGLLRAEKIVAFFQEKCSFPADALVPVSFADKKALYPNSQKETRIKNRTISIRLLPTK